MSRDTLLLVDGHNLLFQMFFGMPARIFSPDSRPMQGTMGFVGALLKILRRVEPTHAVVLFDSEQENARAQLDAQYKANRVDYAQVPEEENPFSQLADIRAALDFMRIRHTEVGAYETDDVIAAYVSAYRETARIVISSFDSDFFQLVGGSVQVLRYRGEKTVLCGSAYVRDRCGVEPEQYADFKALVGDAADNIRGADRIGPKTAAKLLADFGSLEQILAHAERIGRPSVRDSVLRHAERLRMNQRLIRLDGSAPVPFPLEALKFTDGGWKTGEVLRAIGLR
ncbi:MAG: 5'-3' exonuclease H3TH domain-containing protein [Hominenteromicrobium sp.]